ncbi:trehalase isoform 2-T2 [Sarcophilus harrisii]
MQTWIPEDWKDSPKFLQNISDTRLRAWAADLHNLWKKLGRKIKPEVLKQPDQYSLIYSAHPFIVPGGRFIEFYYWDSYWVMEGLLLSEMSKTVKGMLQNFLDMVKHYGHIPNGGRVYYQQRSQPPLLTLMMDRYLKYTNDLDFLRENINILDQELNFWRHNRSVSISHNKKNYTLNRYHVPYGGPRPESYSKDAELAELLPMGARESLWTELKGGAESGWDFSSRWFIGSNYLLDIKTSQIVPVDLNAILCQAENLMSTFYSQLGNLQMSENYLREQTQRKEAMKALLWNETLGSWFDYNLENGQQNHAFYPSNLSPLWAGCFSDLDTVKKNIKYLEDNKILAYKHGVPTSLQISGQQWDFPNAWAPLQDLVVKGLAESASAQAQEAAFQLAQKWIQTNFDVYQKNKAMYEKVRWSSSVSSRGSLQRCFFGGRGVAASATPQCHSGHPPCPCPTEAAASRARRCGQPVTLVPPSSLSSTTSALTPGSLVVEENTECRGQPAPEAPQRHGVIQPLFDDIHSRDKLPITSQENAFCLEKAVKFLFVLENLNLPHPKLLLTLPI